MIVETWMTRGVRSVPPETTIGAASELLSRLHIRRLVVLDGERLVGIVTRADLLKRPETARVQQVMAREVTTVTAATPLEVAAKLMVDHKIGALPVVDAGGRVIGIVTESDAMRALIAAIAVAGPGVRLTFRAADPTATVQFVVDAARRHAMQVLSILVTGRDDDRRVLAKLSGPHGDALIDDAWRSGQSVMSALRL